MFVSKGQSDVSKAEQWKNIFGRGKKPSVQVRVGNRTESLTDTQAQRFDNLSRSHAQPRTVVGGNPFEQQRYSLEDAAFRLMVSESEILALAAAGTVSLFADVGGLHGHWRRQSAANETVDSAEITLHSGYLALSTEACRRLCTRGCVTSTTYDYPKLSDPAATGLHADVLAMLTTWRQFKICFVAREARRVTPETVVLLDPLTVSGAD